MTTTTRTIQIFQFSTMPELATEGWDPNACDAAEVDVSIEGEQLTPAETAEIERTALAASERVNTYLILGCGESTIPAVRAADNDEENWTLARVLLHAPMSAPHAPERWCVLVAGVTEDELDADHATIAYHSILDFKLALGACMGVNVREINQIRQAIAAMRAANAI